jgi:HSP20 family molecular chaperone IbpA
MAPVVGLITPIWFVPPTVNTEAITCGYENGVLTLVLPKLESAKMRPIKVSGKVEKTEKQAAHAAAR